MSKKTLGLIRTQARRIWVRSVSRIQLFDEFRYFFVDRRQKRIRYQNWCMLEWARMPYGRCTIEFRSSMDSRPQVVDEVVNLVSASVIT